MNRFERWVNDFPEKHPDFPLILSIIALIISIVAPLVRSILEGMT